MTKQQRPSLAADAAARLETSVLKKTAAAADSNTANLDTRKNSKVVRRKSANTEERKPVKLSFSLPARTHAQLKMLAAQRYKKIGALVEELINAELMRQK